MYIVHMVMHIGICNALEVHIGVYNALEMHIGEYTAYRMHVNKMVAIKCLLVIIYEDAILVN